MTVEHELPWSEIRILRALRDSVAIEIAEWLADDRHSGPVPYGLISEYRIRRERHSKAVKKWVAERDASKQEKAVAQALDNAMTEG